MSFFNAALFSSPTAFMQRPRETAKNTIARTEVFVLNTAVILDGTMLRITFNGLEPVDPAEPSRPST